MHFIEIVKIFKKNTNISKRERVCRSSGVDKKSRPFATQVSVCKDVKF